MPLHAVLRWEVADEIVRYELYPVVPLELRTPRVPKLAIRATLSRYRLDRTYLPRDES